MLGGHWLGLQLRVELSKGRGEWGLRRLLLPGSTKAECGACLNPCPDAWSIPDCSPGKETLSLWTGKQCVCLAKVSLFPDSSLKMSARLRSQGSFGVWHVTVLEKETGLRVTFCLNAKPPLVFIQREAASTSSKRHLRRALGAVQRYFHLTEADHFLGKEMLAAVRPFVGAGEPLEARDGVVQKGLDFYGHLFGTCAAA